MDSVLIRYHEIALKKGNRAYFTEMLKRNIVAAVKDLGAKEIRSLPARLVLTFRDKIDPETLTERISSVFGIANFSLVQRTGRDIEQLRSQILAGLNGARFASFRIDTQRGDKSFPLNSPEINRQLGAAVQQKTGARVDLDNPEFTVYVEILPKDTYFGFNKLPGAGGLPVGTSGRLLSLISGGFDSPVAAYRMMQRGCRVIFVHFHSAPYQDKTSQDKVRDLVKRLTRHQFQSRLYMVPFGEIQRQIVAAVARPLRVVLYRRMMLRIGERIARREKARALVTGDGDPTGKPFGVWMAARHHAGEVEDDVGPFRHGLRGDARLVEIGGAGLDVIGEAGRPRRRDHVDQGELLDRFAAERAVGHQPFGQLAADHAGGAGDENVHAFPRPLRCHARP